MCARWLDDFYPNRICIHHLRSFLPLALPSWLVYAVEQKKHTKFNAIAKWQPIIIHIFPESTAQIHSMQKEIKLFTYIVWAWIAVRWVRWSGCSLLFWHDSTKFFSFPTKWKKNEQPKFVLILQFIGDTCSSITAIEWYQINQLTTKNWVLWCWVER